MKRSIKIILVCASIVMVLVVGAFIVVFSGFLVRPTTRSLAKRAEVPAFDILEWQFARELDILAEYKAADYTFNEPFVIIDPYLMNPLSALVMFETESYGDVEVTIIGDCYFSTFTYVKAIGGTHAEIPIIGLYADRENKVIMRVVCDNGTYETNELLIITEPLPADFQILTPVTSIPEKMEPGITIFIACFEQTYTALVDSNAQVRGVLSNKRMAHGTNIILLKNGNLLGTGDEYKQIPYHMTSLWEFNWLGKVFKEYKIPNAIHHGIQEIPSGNILVVSNHANMFQSGTREDVIVIIDRATGAVIREYDFRNILDETRAPFHHFHPEIINPPVVDWMHTNFAVYDEVNNAVIVSSPIQSMVVSIDADTEEINWILGPHEGFESETSARLTRYLLSPIGNDFEWHWTQHTAIILTGFDDDNPNTIDIMLFDNGQNRSFAKERAISAHENFSRAVHYRINHVNMTVEQIWQYGKERGPELYATYLGGVNYMPQTGNRLITFGGMLRNSEGIPSDDIIGGVTGDIFTRSAVIEATESGEVVFEVQVKESEHSQFGETYQAARIPLFSPQSFNYVLGQIKGERLGSSYACYLTDEVSPPNFFFGRHSATFNRVSRQDDRIIIDGNLTHNGHAHMLTRTFIIFRSRDNTYTYQANSGLNGRFFFTIDLNELKPGDYHIDIIGAHVEGNDAQGERTVGHFRTKYKVRVE